MATSLLMPDRGKRRPLLNLTSKLLWISFESTPDQYVELPGSCYSVVYDEPRKPSVNDSGSSVSLCPHCTSDAHAIIRFRRHEHSSETECTSVYGLGHLIVANLLNRNDVIIDASYAAALLLYGRQHRLDFDIYCAPEDDDGATVQDSVSVKRQVLPASLAGRSVAQRMRTLMPYVG